MTPGSCRRRRVRSSIGRAAGFYPEGCGIVARRTHSTQERVRSSTGQSSRLLSGRLRVRPPPDPPDPSDLIDRRGLTCVLRHATENEYSRDDGAVLTLGSRPAAGLQTLDLSTGVRIPPPHLANPANWPGCSLTTQLDFGTSASPRPQGVEKPGVRDRPQNIVGGYSGRAESRVLSRVCARGPNEASAEGGLRICPHRLLARLPSFQDGGPGSIPGGDAVCLVTLLGGGPPV